jgi:cyclopropane fatty-acyl-phospholipid synthase-like methyltransferase
MKTIFEKQFKEKGFGAQRKYPNEFLIQFLAVNFFSRPDRKNVRILELGCGSGANLWMMAKEGFDAHGIDSAPTGVKLTKEMLRHWGVEADVRAADMLHLPFKDTYFDAVVDVVSMQHLNWKEHGKCLKEVKRALKPEGLFFTFHLGGGSTSASKGRKIDAWTIDNIKEGYPLAGNGPTCFPSAKALASEISKSGFEIVSAETMTRTYKNKTQKIEYLVIIARKK